MDDVRHCRDEAGEKEAGIDGRARRPRSEKKERQHCEARDRVSAKILRVRIVETVEIELKQRRSRPNEDGSQDGGVTSNECFGSFGCHLIGAIDGLRTDWKEMEAGLQLIYVSI